VAAFSGGTHHGFAPVLGNWWLAATWKLSAYAVGTASCLFIAAAVLASVTTPAGRAVAIGLTAVQAAVYALWMIHHNDFLYVVVDYVPALLLVMALQARAAWTRGEPSGRWVVMGVLVSLAGAAVQQSSWNLSAHFNHNDLYHVIQMAGLYLLHRGGLLLRP
jgi:hypothetical protein